jgi:ABC-type dipeptide/oligopeptide/nickel transport system permease subunit
LITAIYIIDSIWDAKVYNNVNAIREVIKLYLYCTALLAPFFYGNAHNITVGQQTYYDQTFTAVLTGIFVYCILGCIAGIFTGNVLSVVVLPFKIFNYVVMYVVIAAITGSRITTTHGSWFTAAQLHLNHINGDKTMNFTLHFWYMAPVYLGMVALVIIIAIVYWIPMLIFHSCEHFV